MLLKRVLSALLVVAALSATTTVAPGRAAQPEMVAPPGQVTIVSINAKQSRILDVLRFTRLHALTLDLQSRPAAFDGGASGAVSMPDVIAMQEISQSNLEIFQKMMNQRTDFNYLMTFSPNSKTKLLYNADTVALVGDPVEVQDPCLPVDAAGSGRAYMFARFTETESGLPFSVADVHLLRRYPEGGTTCRERNVTALRDALADEAGAVVIAGDFNQRAVSTPRECDVNEETEPSAWWSLMTSPDETGRVYSDSVRDWHRTRGIHLDEEWTHEQKNQSSACDGSVNFRRTRIDYVFVADGTVAAAHADHPGWATEQPGSHRPENRYSDHRWLWVRVALGGPAQPQGLTAVPGQAGVVDLSWQAVEGVSEYRLYRASPGQEYSLLADLDVGTLTYQDIDTHNGVTYRYAVAPIDSGGLQGAESIEVEATADAVGPRVVSITPPTGAFALRDVEVRVRFDEPFDPTSVTANSIDLRLKGRRIAGQVVAEGTHVLTFNPKQWLKPGKTYLVIVRQLRDALGNRGVRFISHFQTGS